MSVTYNPLNSIGILAAKDHGAAVATTAASRQTPGENAELYFQIQQEQAQNTGLKKELGDVSRTTMAALLFRSLNLSYYNINPS